MSQESATTGSVEESTGRLSVRDAGLAFESLLPTGKVDKSGAEAKTSRRQTESHDADARLNAHLEREGAELEAEEEETAETAEEEAEETEEVAEEEAEVEEEVESESAEEDERKRAPQDAEFTVHHDGKDVQVKLSELKNGYLRQADYTRKTQDLATQRKTQEQELAQARQERAEYAELLPKLRVALEGEKEPDWAELREKQPQNFAVEWASWQQRQAQIQSIAAEQTRVGQRQAQEFEAKRSQFAAEQRNQLLTKLPSWKDAKVAKKASEAIVAAMKAVGFGDDELQVFDHRALMILDKAAKYDAIRAAAPDLRNKVKKAPTVRPGGGTPRSPAQAANARLNSTGKVRDAARVLEGFLR